VYEECESCEACVSLKNFWCKVILGLLLFLPGLMSSILSFVTEPGFGVKRLLVKKHRACIYCAHQTFLWENPSGVRRS